MCRSNGKKWTLPSEYSAFPFQLAMMVGMEITIPFAQNFHCLAESNGNFSHRFQCNSQEQWDYEFGTQNDTLHPYAKNLSFWHKKFWNFNQKFWLKGKCSCSLFQRRERPNNLRFSLIIYVPDICGKIHCMTSGVCEAQLHCSTAQMQWQA